MLLKVVQRNIDCNESYAFMFYGVLMALKRKKNRVVQNYVLFNKVLVYLDDILCSSNFKAIIFMFQNAMLCRT